MKFAYYDQNILDYKKYLTFFNPSFH